MFTWKFGMLRQQLQLLVENLEALLRHIVRHHVVDADLHVIQARVFKRSIRSAVSR